MHLKNLKPQKTSVFCKDGSMLHLRSRQEVDISKIELDKSHLDSMIAKGSVVLRDKSSKSEETKAFKPEDSKSKPKGK